MENSFWFGYKFEKFLLPFVNITTYEEFLVACLCLFTLTLIYEILKIIQMKAKLKTVLTLQKKSDNSNDTNRLLGNIYPRSIPSVIVNRLLCLETGIYFVELTLGYIIMMIVMTYNVYFLLIAVTSSSLVYCFMGQLMMNFQFELTMLTKPDGDSLSLEPDDTITVEDTYSSETSKPETVHM